MSSTTPLLGIKNMVENAAGNEVVANEAFRRLEVFASRVILSRNLGTPPGAPSPGNAYIIPPSASGEWALHVNDVTWWSGGRWRYFTPSTAGPKLHVVDEAVDVMWTGSTWSAAAAQGTGMSFITEGSALIEAPSISWDAAQAIYASVSIAESRFLELPTNMEAGQLYVLSVTQLTGGNDNLAFDSGYLFENGNPPNLSNGAGKVDILFFLSTGTQMVMTNFIKNVS